MEKTLIQKQQMSILDMSKKAQWALQGRHTKDPPQPAYSKKSEAYKRQKEKQDAQLILKGKINPYILMHMSKADNRSSMSMRPHAFVPQSFCRQEGVSQAKQTLAARSLALLVTNDTTPEDLAVEQLEGTQPTMV
ncbi:MAG: hypothetical protein EZS28_028982 [Streblomastix strix]|uniref:Uncharacterized protein n=1 Tax=Streblomastix strix TaxID=222440 RepID=A0A5J4UZ80_9EUKA|nr:MAG: hypothetical protein EZS28_028982 [Streblomastix strix]